MSKGFSISVNSLNKALCRFDGLINETHRNQ